MFDPPRMGLSDELQAMAKDLDDRGRHGVATTIKQAARLLRAEALTDRQRADAEAMEALRGLPDGTRNCIALILMHGRWRVASIYEWDEEKRLSTAADPAAAIMAAAKALEKGDATDDH